MSLSSVGDAAQFFRLRQNSNDLQMDLSRITTELSTGRHADLGRAVDGNFQTLTDLGRGLRLTTAIAATVSEASIDANARQSALQVVEDEISGFAPRILSFSSAGSYGDLQLAMADAPDRFNAAVAALNTGIGGRSLFAGDEPDRPALLPGEDILAALRSVVAGATDANDLVARVEDWFDAPGGPFETTAFLGGAGDPPPVILAEGRQEQAAVTARDPAIREVLAGLALAALASEGAAGLPEPESRQLISAAATKIAGSESSLISLRSDLGASQARIEDARVELEATRSALEIEQARIMEADPYRAATDLEALQARLESLYLITSRLSRLTLTEFLR